MTEQQIMENPFAMMLDPDAVWRALERSERLASLRSRICRPLDKPLIPHSDADAGEFDRSAEGSSDDNG